LIVVCANLTEDEQGKILESGAFLWETIGEQELASQEEREAALRAILQPNLSEPKFQEESRGDELPVGIEGNSSAEEFLFDKDLQESAYKRWADQDEERPDQPSPADADKYRALLKYLNDLT
jgi:hypothetical protein